VEAELFYTDRQTDKQSLFEILLTRLMKSHELITMGGPSDLELGGVNNHSTNKKTHVTQRYIGSQRTLTTRKITIWFPTKLGIYLLKDSNRCTGGKQISVKTLHIKVHR